MAITYVGVGSPSVISDSYDLPVNVAVPSNIQLNDLMILIIKSYSGYTPSVTGWTTLSGFPASINADPALNILYKFATAGQGSIFIDISPTTYMAVYQCVVFRGVDLLSPINVNGGPYDQLAPFITTMTFEAVTTTENRCMVLNILANARGVDSTVQYSNWANANLVSVTEAIDYSSAVNNGGGIGMAYGIKSLAGNTGSTTATRASEIGAVLGATIALTPIASSNGSFFTVLNLI